MLDGKKQRATKVLDAKAIQAVHYVPVSTRTTVEQ